MTIKRNKKITLIFNEEEIEKRIVGKAKTVIYNLIN
jgi:hypothetical protein